jgi:diguanylate cyclase (GGDEF)-like protein/PAS domain S-box-containing protein
MRPVWSMELRVSTPAEKISATGPASEKVLITKAPLPENEAARLEALRGYPIFDAEPRKSLDELVRLAAIVCSTPIALLSLVEANRVLYISKIGAEATEVDRNYSFCAWAVLNRDILVTPDAAKDARFKYHPLVASRAGLRFFACAPLLTKEGHAIGALSVFDLKPRELSAWQIRSLGALARAVMTEFDLNRKTFELERVRADRSQLEQMLETVEELLNRIEKQNTDLARVNAILRSKFAESQSAMESLAASEERYALVVRSAGDGLWDWNIKTNEIYFCPRWIQMLGYDRSEIGSNPDAWFRRVHPEDSERVHAEVMEHLLGLTPHFQNEHRVRHRDGSYRWVLGRGLALRDTNNVAYRMAGSLTDTTHQKEAEERLRHNAFHDVLTGLPNRALFMDRLDRSLSRASHRDDYLFAVLFLDLDRFKVINDSLGHQIGDELLVAIARRLEACLRPGDLVARLGGDEFAVIVDHLKQVRDAAQAAERIQKEMAIPFNLHGQEVFASASIGITLSLTPYERAEDFLRNADTAMYRAKDQGRGRYELFDTGMHADAVAMMQLENDLRRALSRDEFRIYYQPIISLEDWRISGFEALLRWQHAQQGLISPLEFIPMAEETGLIILIDQWVLREACRQLQTWQKQFPSDPPLSISVNLSGKQFAQTDLIERIEGILKEVGIAAGSLKVEITESAIIENTESATEKLKQLKELGIRVSLDDFGTGYSSLSYLHRFPVDTLKIDRSFVTRMNQPKNSEIVRTIVALANNLGMDVIAEGVETGDQIMQLTGMNCEYVQGFLFSQPIDETAATKLLEETYHKGLG